MVRTSTKGRHRRKTAKMRVWQLAVVAVALLIVSGLVITWLTTAGTHSDTKKTTHASPSQSPQTPPSQTPQSPQPVTITVVGTGDVLSHPAVMEASRQADGSFDYAPLAEAVKPYIEGADLALCHQEIPFVKDDSQRAGYPEFRAPSGWAASPAHLGYDGCSVASNHTWDRGRDGIAETLQMLHEQGLGTSGANVSADQNPIQYYKLHRGNRVITVAHLSTTYGTNYGTVAELENNPWLVHQKDPNYMVELAKRARDEGGAQIVIVSVQHGEEYNPRPSAEQRRWAKIFADSGVIDLYLGHHVHVPQSIEKIRGGVNGEGMYAIFGTGNFLSHHMTRKGVSTETGIIAQATMTVDADGKSHVDEVGYIPIVVDYQTSQVFPAHTYRQADYPSSKLSDDFAKEHLDYIRSVIGDTAIEVKEPAKDIAPAVDVIKR